MKEWNLMVRKLSWIEGWRIMPILTYSWQMIMRILLMCRNARHDWLIQCRRWSWVCSWYPNIIHFRHRLQLWKMQTFSFISSNDMKETESIISIQILMHTGIQIVHRLNPRRNKLNNKNDWVFEFICFMTKLFYYYLLNTHEFN